MALKIMGISAGRKNSNGEILLKEALLACQEAGAEVRMINLHDYNIIVCTGCTSCSMGMAQGKNLGCVLDKKDDKKAIMEVMLEQDGLIFSSPTYDLMTNAVLIRFLQRGLSYETSFLETIGAIEHRDRVGGLIATGGSTRAWMSMALETMQAGMFTTDVKIIDMQLATQVPGPGQILLHDDKIARARQLGLNVFKAASTPPAERQWLGDSDMGWCPNCHSNALILGEQQWKGLHYPIECQVCGAGGTLEQTEDKKWKFVIQENGLERVRTTVEGRAVHLQEIGETEGTFHRSQEMKDIVKSKIVKYKEIEFPGLD